jgi:hypothetical protein
MSPVFLEYPWFPELDKLELGLRWEDNFCLMLPRLKSAAALSQARPPLWSVAFCNQNELSSESGAGRLEITLNELRVPRFTQERQLNVN